MMWQNKHVGTTTVSNCQLNKWSSNEEVQMRRGI